VLDHRLSFQRSELAGIRVDLPDSGAGSFTPAHVSLGSFAAFVHGQRLPLRRLLRLDDLSLNEKRAQLLREITRTQNTRDTWAVGLVEVLLRCRLERRSRFVVHPKSFLSVASGEAAANGARP
jgi:hypothetical protein